jgi:hypothetical protein
LAVGEGEAAGDGLAAGLGLAAGVAVSAAGDDDVPAGEFELAAGSQAARKVIARIDESRSVLRPISFVFELLIVLPRWNKIENRDDDCPNLNPSQRAFPHLNRRSLRPGHREALGFKRVLAQRS